MAQHPQQHTQTGTVQQTQPMPAPVMHQTSSPGTRLAAQRQADLIASVRDIPSLNPLAGIMSGQGNQGTACAANMQGHAGTPCSFLGLPRTLKNPGNPGGGKPQ